MRTISCFLVLAVAAPALLANTSAQPAKSAKPAPGMSVKAERVVPQDKIKEAAAKISQSPAPSIGAARAAALNLLAAHKPGYTNADVESLMVMLMQQATKDNEADLREQLAEMKRKNADKEALRKDAQGLKDKKDALSEASKEDQDKLQQLQNRKAQLQRVLSETMKKSSDTSARTSANMK